jgi:protein-disulfide isomerase
MKRLRRTIVLAFAAALFSTGAVAVAAAPKAGAPKFTDMAIGDPKAKITVIEYGSVSCPHCAKWNADVFPAFKAKYLDTGKARYVFRETPIHGALDVAGFRLARCAGPDKYFSTIDALFAGQDQLFNTKDGLTWLVTAGNAVGMDNQQIKTCLSDEAAAKALDKYEEASAVRMHVQGTPTIFVNGKLVTGDHNLQTLEAAIAAAGKSATPKKRR